MKHFTVGPSELYPTVPKHIREALQENIPSLSHRSSKFMDLYKAVDENLKALLHIPATHSVFFTSCALEGMERTIQNTVDKNSFHFVNGSFSREFFQIATDLKKDTERFDAENGHGFDFASVKIPEHSELVCMVQNETSTGVALPLDEIYTLRKRYPKKLFAIDIVSSVPYVDLDYELIDIAIFSVQKGLGLPAGLGVLVVNPRALAKAAVLNKQGNNIGSYHNFIKLQEFAQKYQTRETPNVLDIYLLSKVTKDMLDYGIEKIRKETDEKADLIYNFFDNHTEHRTFVEEKFRSKTTIVIDVKKDSPKILEKLEKAGFLIAHGYGKRKDFHIRIGNFPAHSLSSVKALLQQL